MNGDAFRSHLDFPFVALFGSIVVEQGEFLQVFVPPIHLVVLFKDVFVSHFGMFVTVVDGVGADDDFRACGANGGVGSIFKMLVGDGAVVPFDFVIPFRQHRKCNLLRYVM